MQSLNQLLFSIQRMADDDAVPLETVADLLLYAPCPVKLTMREQIEQIAAAHGAPLSWHVPMGCTSIDPYDPLYREPDPDRLPGIIASIGFGDFWRREFVCRHVQAGIFKAVRPALVNPLYQQANLLDPRGNYTVYGVNPYLFLVDAQRLSGLPLPRTWADLLDDRYRGQIVLCGDGDDLTDAVLLHCYKHFGRQGLQALAANCRGLMHSATMAATIGLPGNQAGIYVIPAFFAANARQKPHIHTIWPDDGAAVSPLYFLAKQAEQERLQPLLDFLTTGFAAIESARWFLPLAGGPSDHLPPELRLQWIGWDFIAQHEVTELRDELTQWYRASVPPAPCS